jgi:hypothetical protein
MNPKEIVERIMTSHWDMAACQCWICRAGREADCAPRGDYLSYEACRVKYQVPDMPQISDLTQPPAPE